MTIFSQIVVGLIGVVAIVVMAIFILVNKYKNRNATIRTRAKDETDEGLVYLKKLQKSEPSSDQLETTILQEAQTGAFDSDDNDDQLTVELSEVNKKTEGTGKTAPSQVKVDKGLPKAGDILNDKYRIERIIGNGSQGSVFVCTNLELGNTWAAKYFNGSLNEKDILVKLNHTSLPKITDVFHENQGDYIIESYIEGRALSDVIKEKKFISEDTAIDWLIQLCDALEYIHSKNVLHMDIKPQNIILTNDNRIILIDFGIATHGDGPKTNHYKVYGYTQAYCSPEQKDRSLNVDRRSDLFSLGVTAYKILSNSTSFKKFDIRHFRKDLSNNFIDVLYKCLEINKEDRIPSAADLKKALLGVKESKLAKEKAIARNKIYRIMMIPLVMLSGYFFYSGYSQYQGEILSSIEVNVERIQLSEQEIQNVEILQIYEDGESRLLEHNQIEWTVEDSDIAIVENGEIIGVNNGETYVMGQYYNHTFKIEVIVDDGVLGVDIKLKYNTDYKTSIFAGSGVRDIIDGNINSAAFLEPTSITYFKGVTYVADRFIRVIKDKEVTTIDTGYIQGDVIRVDNEGNVYIASKEWIDENDQYRIGIFLLEDESVSEIVSFDVLTTEITDFTFDKDNNFYVIMTDYIEETSSVVSIKNDFSEFEVLLQDSEYFAGIAMDKDDNIYLSQPDTAVIYKLNKEKKELEFFAGAKHEKDFVDGPIIKLFEPRSIEIHNNFLYVIDSYIIRKLEIDDGEFVDSETISGNIDFADKPVLEGVSYETTYQADLEMDICWGEDGLYVADTKSNIIRLVKD